jgi:hypothetical protein
MIKKYADHTNTVYDAKLNLRNNRTANAYSKIPSCLELLVSGNN